LGHPAYCQLAKGLKPFNVGRLNRLEASGILELLEKSKLLRREFSDKTLLETFMAADGIAGEFTRTLRLTTSTS